MVEYKWVVLSNTTLATVMSSLDANIVQIALPTIGHKLPGTSPFDLVWVLVGYQLVIAAFLVNLGRLSDIFGRVKLFNFGFALFTASSALCSLSQTGDQLAVFRMVQGLGAAFLISNSAAIITDAFPVEERGMALGTNMSALVVGSVAGLVLGGFLTTVAGWQSIFWVNIPIGLFSATWCFRSLKEISTKNPDRKIDFKGNVTFAAGIFLLLAGLSLYAVGNIAPVEIFGLAGAGGALLVIFFFIETKVPSPMLDLKLFRLRVFSGGVSASMVSSLARGAVTLVLVFYLQSPLMHLSALTAGIYLIPNTISIAVIGPLGGWLSDNYDPRVMMVIGLLVAAAGLGLLVGIGPTTSFWGLAPGLTMVGGGFGMFVSPNRSTVMSAVPAEQRGTASGVLSTTFQIGMSLSRVLAFAIMAAILPVGDISRLFAGTLTYAEAATNDALVNSIRAVFIVSTILLLLAIPPCLLKGKREATPQRGRESSGGEVGV